MTRIIERGDLLVIEIAVVAAPVSTLVVASCFQLESSNVIFLNSFSACGTIL